MLQQAHEARRCEQSVAALINAAIKAHVIEAAVA